MPRPKGSQNKISSEVKEKLQLLIDDLIASLNVDELDANQRIKMLQIALQYTLPRLQAMVIKDDVKDLPLFL
jgi:DNA polymerase III delta prime subunit